MTQLFTEPYMVQFLLHNSLGAWWVSRHPDQTCPVDLTYLRRTDDGAPAAGEFEGWPDSLSEFRLLDLCCGSGHFLVAAFLILVPMRMALEGLDAAESVDAVLRENLHGLELDQRCVNIAAFALALEAWRYPDARGFRQLPELSIAWCGQPLEVRGQDWLSLAEGDDRLRQGLENLYAVFRNAPVIGSLIEPKRDSREDLYTADYLSLRPLIEQALNRRDLNEDKEEVAIAAKGIAHAAALLGGGYTLVVTNVPYLGRGRMNRILKAYCEAHYPFGKADLATCFVSRCIELCNEGGTAALVSPQSWLYIGPYKKMREKLLSGFDWNLLGQLGPRAFEGISGEIVNVCLTVITRKPPTDPLYAVDVSSEATPQGKSDTLKTAGLVAGSQHKQTSNPDFRISLGQALDLPLLNEFANSFNGLSTGDMGRFIRRFWELHPFSHGWSFLQGSVDTNKGYGGREQVVFWEHGTGALYEFVAEKLGRTGVGAWLRGEDAWGRAGVAVSQMRGLQCTLYTGELFDENTAAIIPKNTKHLPAIWAYCTSEEYRDAVRAIDNSSLKVPNLTLTKVPFDLEKWSGAAAKGEVDVPLRPISHECTQWVFRGDPSRGPHRGQVAVCRLLGYHWPAEVGNGLALAEDALTHVENSKYLHSLEDEDGIVCLPAVRGERPANERLLQLLHSAYGEKWNDSVLSKLLAESGSASLDDWLRNQFFDEHCKLFQHRPFIWHIWDGRKRDGFHAPINYHKLAEGDGKGRRLLESLTHSYLGDWIARQEDGVKRSEGGAEDRLAAARELQKRLVAILDGEPPFDIFVRWKPIAEQPIGWEPDINDGVRLNVRPFMAQDLPGGKKGAGILRAKPNIHWKKDRGKEPDRDQAQFPWFWKNGQFTGERVNDVHLTNTEKRDARKAGAK